MHNAQSTKQRNCALALSKKKQKLLGHETQELLVIVKEIAISL